MSFALLQVQVFIPIESLKHSPGYVHAETGVAEDGTATESGKITVKGEKNSVALNILTMMVYGYVTSRAVVMQTPVPKDTMLAAAGGVIYTAGEIYAWNKFKDDKEKSIEYLMREDGDNEEQIEILQKQKEGYDDIAKTAKTKVMIQTAATAAFGVATGVALWDFAFAEAAAVACSACVGPGEAVVAAKEAAEVPTAVSVPQCTEIQGICGSILAANTTSIGIWETTLAAAEAAAAVPGAGLAAAKAVLDASAGLAVCTSATANCQALVTSCLKTTACNVPAQLLQSFSGFAYNDSNSFDNFMRENDKLKMAYIPTKEEISNAQIEIEAEDYMNRFGVASFLNKKLPYYNLERELLPESIGYSEKIKSYAKRRDLDRFRQGEISSATLEEYGQFKDMMFTVADSSTSNLYENSIDIAFQYGIDLFIPSVNANSFLGMFAGVIGLVIALTTATLYKFDLFMTTPEHRAIAWGVGAALGMVAVNDTKKVQKAAEENAEKIQKIIDQLSKVNGLIVDSMSGVDQSIPSLIPFPKTGNDEIPLGDKKAPCINSNQTSGCKSAAGLFDQQKDFSGIGGTFGTLPGDVLNASDDITGSNSISGRGADKLVGIGDRNNAIQNKVRQIKKKVNEKRKSLGKKPIDFDRMNNKLIANLKKRSRKTLAGGGKSAQTLLASLGSGSKEEAKEEVAKAGPSEVKAGSVKAAKARKAPVFSLDLDENPGGNEGLNADDVLANQAAANALNGEAVDDIVTNKSVSIFKVISVRYLKSGFSRLLEEEKKAKVKK